MKLNRQIQADLMLVIVTLGWGVSYLLMDICLSDLDPFTLNSYRFLGAFVLAAAVFWKKIIHVNKETLKYSVIAGASLVLVYVGATFGVKYTTLSNSGFLCAMAVLFTPIFGFIFLKQRLSKKLTLVIAMCVVGIAMMTLTADFSINMANLKGDLLCLMCAVFYAVNLLVIERAVAKPEVDAFQLGVYQLGVVGLINVIMAFIVETPHLPQTPAVWGAVIFLSLFCTGLAFIVQPIAQQYTTASHVGVIFTLEPVFAAIVAFFIANERLLPQAYVGMILMLAGTLIMEIDFSKFGKKKA